MDRDPEMQGAKPSKQEAELANDRPAEQTLNSPKPTTVVETVTTETIKPSKLATDPAQPTATEIITETTTKTVGEMPATEVIKPKKKSHKGLVALIITLVIIIVAAAGAAVWYFVYYSNPDKVAYDAITNFLQQKTVVTDGNINGLVNLGGNDVAITGELKQKSNGLAGENVLDLKAKMLDANGESISEHDYEIELSAIVLNNGVFYIRTDKLMETIDIMLKDMSVPVDDLDTTMATIYNLFEQVDGEWWQINIPDIIDTVLSDSEIAAPAKEFYACLVNTAKNDVNSQIAKVYQNHPFIKVEKAGSDEKSIEFSSYAASLDYDQMSAFLGATTETDYYKNVENCFNKFIVEDLGGEMTFDHTVPTADELREVFDPIGVLTMDITNFGHELKALGISYHLNEKEENEEDSYKYYIFSRFNFSHPDVAVAAPENYRSIDELVELIVEAAMTVNDIPLDSINENSDLMYDEATGEWYFLDEEVDSAEEI